MHLNPILNLQCELHNADSSSTDEFLITREKLAQVVETNGTTESLQDCGGIDYIVSALRTNLDVGILGDQRDLHLRRQAFGSNCNSQCPPTQSIKHIKHILSHALRDTTILLLLCCAILSLAIGIKTDGAAEVMIDGAFILLSICFVLSFGTLVRFLRARWIGRKSLKGKNKIWVVRNGLIYQILESELVVGDIVCLQTGDWVPADGIFIDGDSFDVEKTNHPSLFTGAKVEKCYCCMLVTSVGENTETSRLMRSIVGGIKQTQLLDTIEKTNSKLEKIWLSLSLILLVVQFVHCFMINPDNRNLGVKNMVEDLMKESIHLMKKERLKSYNLVTMLCVLLFASRDGLPLAVFISLLYGANRMKSVDAIVQQIQASATVGLATTICTCETPDLALNHAQMADLWIGFDLVTDHVVDKRILDALKEGISVHAAQNSNGSLEEITLLTWARAVLGLNLDMEFLPMSRSEDTDLCCSIVRRESEANKVMHVHWKGSPHLILAMCSHYYSVDGEIATLDANKVAALLQNLTGCRQCCFAFAYKQEIKAEEEEEEHDLESGLTLLGFVGLKNPYSPKVIEAITDLLKSGVEIKVMVDGDINMAKIIAMNTGLIRVDEDEGPGLVVEAGEFRISSDGERMKMVENIRVMANATPADKLLMVQCLRENRRVVVAAVSAIRDSPVLKEADVGIFMGQVSKEDGDILVPSSRFSQIPQIVNLGRRVCRNLENILQLLLTMEISTFTVNIISLAATSKEAVTPYQVVWIYVIVGILGGMGVAITIQNDGDPVYGPGGIVNRSMCRNIALQSSFQVCVILMMVINGKVLFHVNEYELETMVFTCYAFCQVFLLIPAIELKINDVKGGRSCLFLAVVAVVAVLQVALVEITGIVAHYPRLKVKQWCICIGIASFSLPLNFICCKFHSKMPRR